MAQPSSAEAKLVDKLDNPQIANRQTAITGLTDSTGGTANNTLENLADGTTYANDHGSIENNFADLAAKVNEILDLLEAHGLMADN